MLTHITQNWYSRGLSLSLSLLLALPIAILLPSTPAFAADTGFMSPTATGTYHNEWATPSDAFLSNDAYATETTENDLQSYENFGFNVPIGSLIHGIEMNKRTNGNIETKIFIALKIIFCRFRCICVIA